MKLGMLRFARNVASTVIFGCKLTIAILSSLISFGLGASSLLAASDSGGGLSLLAVNPGLIIWTFIIFGIVFLILQKFAWRPIAASLDARAQKIKDDVDQAQELRHQAEEKLALYEKKIDQAKDEANQLLEKKLKEAEQNQKTIIVATRKETTEMVENSKRQIQDAQDRAQAEIQQKLIHLSVEVAKKILSREIKSSDHDHLFEQGVATLKQEKIHD